MNVKIFNFIIRADVETRMECQLGGGFQTLVYI